MQKFFINAADFTAKTLPPDLVYQASKVLRYQIGSQFIVGVDRKNYLVAITKINLKELEYQVLEELAIDNELDVAVTIIQGYPKGDKFEDIVKHGTELGASCFIPCLLERSQFKVEEKRLANKVVRFNKIAKEASEQSMRNIIPEVKEFMKLKDIALATYDIVYVCYEESAKAGELSGYKETLKGLKKGANIAFLIGPEGEIDEKEIKYLKTFSNIKFISLGKRILRTETAALYALSTVSYERELI